MFVPSEDDAAITVTTPVESSMMVMVMVMVTATAVQTARKGLHRIAADRHVIAAFDTSFTTLAAAGWL
jgi:hypothetical protein